MAAAERCWKRRLYTTPPLRFTCFFAKRLTIKLYSSESGLDLAASLRASSTTEFGVSGHLPRAGQASNRLS